MSRTTRIAALAAVLVFLMSFAAPAFAAPVQWESVEVVAHEEGTGSILIISGMLPDEVKLPARVVLSAPAGSQLQWAGEVLGGDVSADPSAQPTKSTQGSADVYEFTMTKARRGQIEVLAPAVATFDGSAYSASLSWPSAMSVPQVAVSVRLPSGASITRPVEGSVVEPAEGGASYYTRKFSDVKPGDDLALDFGYQASAPAAAPVAAAQQPATRSAASTFVPLLLGAAALAAGLFLIVAISRKMQTRSANYEEVAGTDTDIDEQLSMAETADDDVSTGVGGLPADADPADEPDGEGVASRRRSPAGLMVAGVVAVAVIAFAIVSFASKPQTIDGKLSKSFGGEASACTSATIAVVPNDGVDLARSSEKLFASFEGMQGIGIVTLDVEEPSVNVEFCESTTNEQAIRQALGSSGLVTY